MKLLSIFTALLVPCQVQAAAVFAHFMVGNTISFEQSDWENNINLAQEAHIDAFALNMAQGWIGNNAQLSLAFSAANAKGFKLFFSFDYAGNGAWPQAEVISLIQEYGSNGAYYQYNNKPLVSTFEGPASSGDWVEIKAQTGCFFIPNWSSIGAGPALAKGVADGLFSWAAWPWSNWRMDTYTDAAYNISLNGLPYMMPVAPWFYTNLPGYDKNWQWIGDSLWFDRWQQVWSFQPEFVEIISWNDFGECHYIGPLDDSQYDLFNSSLGKARFNYAENMPHDAWRQLLPFAIDTYKVGIATVTEEILTVWNRINPVTACGLDNTLVNTASQEQIEFFPIDVMGDTVFFSALLGSYASFTVVIGGVSSGAQDDWDSIPDGEIGIYHGSYPFKGNTGAVQVCMDREGQGAFLCSFGGTITTDCSSTGGYTNWNAYTDSTTVGLVSTAGFVTPPRSLSQQTCVGGFGTNDFADICEFTCALGYCPSTACTCSAMGKVPTIGDTTGPTGYSKNGMIEFEGLCAFACEHGFCSFSDNTVCVTTPTTLYIPPVSPFSPPACTAGTGTGDFSDLCAWACGFGYCPIAVCTCTSQGALDIPPAPTAGITAKYLPTPGVMDFDDLCTFTCSRGHCPDVCSSNLACTSGSGTDNYAGLCSYSCGFDFCPEPCTCLTNGTKVLPPALVPGVIGFGNGGLDANTYDPLCNFTCSHGYCPSGACSEEIDINATPSISFTSGTAFVPFQTSPSYSAGDGFLFDTPIPSDLNLNLILVGNETVWEDKDCSSVSAPGVDGDTLGCIAAAMAWLTYSIYLDGGPVGTTPVRSLPFSRHRFQLHSEWEPLDNCTTKCRLLAGSPSNTWTPVGNGTYNGIYHELHFIHNDNTIGHRAWQGDAPRNSTLAARQYHVKYLIKGQLLGGNPIYVDYYTPKDTSAGLDEVVKDYTSPVAVSEWMGNAVEEAVAESDFNGMCFTIIKGGQVVSSSIVGVGQSNAPWASIGEAEADLTKCESDDTSSGSVLITCWNNLTYIDPTLADDPDGNQSPNLFSRSLYHSRILGSRSASSGQVTNYTIRNYLDPTGLTIVWESQTYPNGGNGADLQAAGGDTHVYALANRGVCHDATIVSQAPLTGPNAVTVNAEHIIERVTMAYFFEFIQNPELDLLDGNGPVRAPANLQPILFNVIRDYMAIPYLQWPFANTFPNTPPGSLFQDIGDALGSTTNPDVMTNLDSNLNNVKSRVWDTFTDPSADSTFLPLANNPTIANTQSALDLLRSGIAVFNYLNDANVQRLLGNIHDGAAASTTQFDTINNAINPSQQTNLHGLWVTFINFWAQRIANRYRTYVNQRIAQLSAPWNNILAGNPTVQQRGIANAALAEIALLTAQVAGQVFFNRNTLT